MFKNLIWLGVLGATACGVGALPELPTAATEDTPNKVEILGVWPAQGDDQLVPAVLVVGRAYKLKVRVSGLGDVLLPSEPLAASIESESFERVISFPRGNTCITPAEPESADDEGVCTIVFYAEGLVRDVGIMVRAQRALAVMQSIDLELRADLASARLRFMVPGVGTATWFPGDADPLPALQAMGLSLEAAQASPLVIELKDAYDNPLVGQRVELADWLEPQAPVQPEPDAGAVDDGGVSTDALVSEAGAVDARIADALLMDSGYQDAAVDDAGDVGAITDTLSQDALIRALPDASLRSDVDALDGGRELASGRLADGRVALYRHDGVRCSTEVDNDARHEVLSDALGRATFCLKAGEVLGAWQLVIKLAELIDPQTIAARSQDGFVLKGRTRAGDPDRLILLGHDNEGDEPLSRCEAGDVTPLEYFQVLSVGGRPVAGAEVDVSVEGAVRLLSSANPVSDDQGRIAVQVSCPITMPNRSTVHARLLGASVGETRKQALLYVRLEVQRIERLRLMVDQPGQELLSLGRGQALEPIYFRVLAEGSRGTPAVDSRLNLQVLTSQDNNDLLFLSNDRCDVQPERRVHGQSVYTDADGVFRFAVCGVGLSTVLRPMALVVRAHGQVTQLQVPITLLAGDPVRVVADPPGRVTTMVGGAAGALDVVVQDEAGNGVPGAAVQIVRPPSIELTGCSHQCTTLEGVTNAIGRYSAWISRVTSEGEHDLTLRASKGAWSGVAAKTVAAGLGAATALAFYREERLVVPFLGAPQVDVPVGGALEQPLTLRLENRLGGGVVGEGIAVSLIEGEPSQCGRIGLEGRVTNEAGEIVFGGDQGVALEAGPALGDCMWRFSAGVDLQVSLRVHQVAGAPYGGSPEVDEGTTLTSLQAQPTDWNQDAPIATDVRVRAVDRFGNPKPGLRMWLGATNCWIRNPVQQLDENGEGTWRVAGGRDYTSPCTLHMRYAGGEWQAAQPLVIPVSGLSVPVIESLDRLERETTTTFRPCPTGTYYSGNACYYRGAHLTMSQIPNDQHHMAIRVDDNLVIRPDALFARLNASCFEPELNDPYANCSRVQLLDVNTAGDELVYTAIADLPIRWRVVLPDANANRLLEFHVQIPQTLLADGRDKALRIVQPDGRTVGPPHRFYVQPPVRWVRQSTRVLSPDNPNEQARLWGGHRLQLDDDEAQEAVFCGNDDQGGILAIINRQSRDDPYPETLRGLRLWSMPTAPKMPVASRANLACALGDLDDDGRNDLVVPLPTNENNRIPRLMLLRGIPQEPFFDVDNSVTIFLNSAPAYPAHPPSQVAVSDQPNRIWVCFGALDEGDSPDGACVNDAALSVFVQSNPFVDNPNLAIGAQTTHATSGNNWPVLRHFQVADQVYFDGLGTVTADGKLLAKSKPWPEQPLTLDGTTYAASHFDEVTRVITTVSASGNVRRWDHHGALLAEFSTPQQVGAAVFAPSGDRAATVHEDDVYVWRTSDGAILYTLSGTAAYWTATNSEYPEPVLVVSQTRFNDALEQNIDVRTYTPDGVLIREFPGAFYWFNNQDNRAYRMAASPGAEHVYIHRDYSDQIRRYDGETGAALDDLVFELGLRRVQFNHDASRVSVRGHRQNQSNHNQWLELPTGQILYEDCTNNGDADCDAAQFSQGGNLIFSPDHRFYISNSYAWIRNADRPLQWRGYPFDPTQGSAGLNSHVQAASNQSGYLLKTLTTHGWAGNHRSVYVLPMDQTPGGVTPVVYSSREVISGRQRHPEHNEFRFSTFLVPQAEDHGDVMLLTRRGYRHGLTNHFYDDNNYGLQWGRADAYTLWRGPLTVTLGDGEIVIARPETWRSECGNGSLDPGELVDPGQPWSGRWDCGASLVERCGNGVVDAGEDCDDGNEADDDDCVGCLVTHPGWRQDDPIGGCHELADDAVDGTYWVGDLIDAEPIYCARVHGAWWTLAGRFTNDDGLQWRGANWTNLDHQFGDCTRMEERGASDCRSRAWDHVRTTELLAVERLERNDQVYQGSRIYRLDQPRRMSEIANLAANTDIFDSTQLVSGGDNLLALAPSEDPPHLLVNYDLANDGCRLATSTNSGDCTSGLACRQNNRDYWCHGDVNTDGRDTLGYRHHGEQPAWPNHTVHLFVREQGN